MIPISLGYKLRVRNLKSSEIIKNKEKCMVADQPPGGVRFLLLASAKYSVGLYISPFKLLQLTKLLIVTQETVLLYIHA